MNSVKLSANKMMLMMVMFTIITGCSNPDVYTTQSAGRLPFIDPDYSSVNVPVNIAPLNFNIKEEGRKFYIKAKSSRGTIINLTSHDGKVCFPLKQWKKLLAESAGDSLEIEIAAEDRNRSLKEYDPLRIYVSKSKIDPYLCYRLLYPGYESWVDMKIVQRSVEDFRESPVMENQLLREDCINCHSFLKNNPGEFLVHERGPAGGTYFVSGKTITRRNLRTDNMIANAVYPSWHPSGKYIAFSSNKTVQSFHMLPSRNIEVYDRFSSIVIYDAPRNGMFALPGDDSIKFMETYPCWSPDGKYLYYCRATQIKEFTDITKVKYDLARRSFDPGLGTFGKAEVVFAANERNKSVSFPSISPDGARLIFTLFDYGTFSIWHKEADLWLLDLKSLKADSLAINSNESESWHSWSSDGSWLVFSSKRGDGLTARPYFAYFGTAGKIGKPFVLPQRDPSFYGQFEKTFNRPELITGRIKPGPRDFKKASQQDAVTALWVTRKNGN